MQYLGGKHRQAKRIAAVIAAARGDRTEYVEPFCGAVSVTAKVAALGVFDTIIASDLNADLIDMWKAVQDGWVPPDVVSRERYEELRHADPSPERTFAGFGCSFGGKWFDVYATDNERGDDYAGQAFRGVMRKGGALDGVKFEAGSYDRFVAHAGQVIYCDPPYRSTEAYGAVDEFDSDAFWATAQGWSEQGALVIVTEYEAPDGWTSIHAFKRNVSLSENDAPKVDEHMFVFGGMADPVIFEEDDMRHNIVGPMAQFATPVAELALWGDNPRQGDADQIAAMLESVGQWWPIVYRTQDDGSRVVYIGNHRLKAAVDLGWTHIAAIDAATLTVKQMVAFALGDNRVSERGSFDEGALADELSALMQLDVTMLPLTGYDADDVAALLSADAPAPAPPDEPDVGPGEDVTVVCPNCQHEFARTTVVKSHVRHH